MNQTVKSAIVEEFRSLGPMPDTAAKVLRLLRSPRTDASQIEEAVRYDPGLTGNVLRLANSAYFGHAGRIGSVRQAVVRLGWERVFQLVVASSVSGVMNRAVPGYDLPQGELWRHAVGVSVAAENLSRELRIPVPEETFTAALLHDVGKLVMGHLVGKDFERIEEAAMRGLSFETAEREVLGIDHAEAGAEALESWSFPTDLVCAVRWHHEPDASHEPSVMLDIVHVADVLCQMLGIGTGREGLGYRPSVGATERLNIRISTLEAAASRTVEGLDELMDALRFNPERPENRLESRAPGRPAEPGPAGRGEKGRWH